MKFKFEKIKSFDLPFASDPITKHGRGCLRLRFILKGQKGAVQFIFITGTLLPCDDKLKTSGEWSGWDVGYHSRYPMYDDHCYNKCDILEEGKCYNDGSGLSADEWVNEIFSKLGLDHEDIIWKKLEDYYRRVFEDNKETGGFSEALNKLADIL